MAPTAQLMSAVDILGNQGAGGGGGDGEHGFFGFHLDQILVDADAVADVDQPFTNGGFGGGFAELRHTNGQAGHLRTSQFLQRRP